MSFYLGGRKGRSRDPAHGLMATLAFGEAEVNAAKALGHNLLSRLASQCRKMMISRTGVANKTGRTGKLISRAFILFHHMAAAGSTPQRQHESTSVRGCSTIPLISHQIEVKI